MTAGPLRVVPPRGHDSLRAMPPVRATVFRVAGASAVLVLALWQLGCGQSFRIIHRGDVHFERCYGSDFDARIPPEYKLGCWAAWLRHYTFGQPLHRIQYAESRVAAITAGLPGPNLPQQPVLEIIAPAYASDTADAEPPADRSQPPPLAIPPSGDSAEAAEASTRPVPAPRVDASPPESRCAAICRTDWSSCVPACSQPETRDACRTTCDGEFRTCMRACF